MSDATNAPFGDADFVPFDFDASSCGKILKRDPKEPRPEKSNSEKSDSYSRRDHRSSREKNPSELATDKNKQYSERRDSSDRSRKREKDRVREKDRGQGYEGDRESKSHRSSTKTSSLHSQEEGSDRKSLSSCLGTFSDPKSSSNEDSLRSKQRRRESDSSSKDKKRIRAHSRSRSRSPGHSCGRTPNRSRVKQSPPRRRNASPPRNRSRSHSRSRGRKRSPHRGRHGRSRSRSWGRSFSSGGSPGFGDGRGSNAGGFYRDGGRPPHYDNFGSFKYGGGSSRSSSRRHRVSTPDSDVVPLDERPRTLKNWDVPPEGYENFSTDDAKASGNFPLPSHLAAAKISMGNNGNAHPSTLPSAQEVRARLLNSQVPAGGNSNPSVPRQHRRLYVGNLPQGINDTELVNFFNNELTNLGLNATASSAIFGSDRSFAFVELKEPEDATAAMALDSIPFLGNPLRIRRPKDYVPPPGEENVVKPLPFLRVQPDMIVNQGASSISYSQYILNQNNPDKLFIGGIPHNLTEAQIRELLESMGELRAFQLITDPATRVSRGFAFCEFISTAVTDLAIASLHDMEIGERKLVVQRASSSNRYNGGSKNRNFNNNSGGDNNFGDYDNQGSKGANDDENSTGQERERTFDVEDEGPVSIASALAAAQSAAAASVAKLGISHVALSAAGSLGEETEVLMLLNVIDSTTLENQSAVKEVISDINEECSKFGPVVEIYLPLFDAAPDVPCVPKIFVKFASRDACTKALLNIAGRKYSGRTVVASYISIERLEKICDGVESNPQKADLEGNQNLTAAAEVAAGSF